MRINIVRLQDGHPIREPLDTTLIFNIEFVLDDKQSICVMVADDVLYISSSGTLRITPQVSNAITIETISRRSKTPTKLRKGAK